jgi:pimeloyl-ACP methyl ester carboxylesterase
MVDMVPAWNGARLAVHRMGAGRPVLMLHGLFSSAEVNWIKFGHAARLAEAGFEAIMPDLRAHGASEVPQAAGDYPPDVLVKDVQALCDALGLKDGAFDLAGFSLGARTAVQAVLAGLAPRRLVLGGMGLEGLGEWQRRSAFFVDAIDRFDEIRSSEDPAYMAKSFMRTMKVDRPAARMLLLSVQDVPVKRAWPHRHADAGGLRRGRRRQRLGTGARQPPCRTPAMPRFPAPTCRPLPNPPSARPSRSFSGVDFGAFLRQQSAS